MDYVPLERSSWRGTPLRPISPCILSAVINHQNNQSTKLTHGCSKKNSYFKFLIQTFSSEISFEAYSVI